MTLTKQTKKYSVIQFALLISFFLTIVFAPLGTVNFDLHINSFVKGNFDVIDLSLGVGGCIAIGVATIIEIIMLVVRKKVTYVIGAIICMLRLALPVLLVLMDAVEYFHSSKIIDLTVFPYILLTIGICSLVVYWKLEKVLSNSQIQQQETN